MTPQNSQDELSRVLASPSRFGENKRTGWVCLYRSIMEKGFYKKSAYLHLWVHILLSASHSESEFLWNGKIQKLLPGQFLTGRKQLSADTGIPETTVERILEMLEIGHQIGQQKTNRFRLLTVINWNEYQQVGQENGHPADIQRTSSGHPADTFNNENNTNNEDKKNSEVLETETGMDEKKEIPEKPASKKKTSTKGIDERFLRFFSAYPRKVGKGQAEKAFSKVNPDDELLGKMLLALQWQVKLWTDPQFIPHPATWLNGKRWEDEKHILKTPHQQWCEIGAPRPEPQPSDEKELSGPSSERDILIRMVNQTRNECNSLERLLADKDTCKKYPDRIDEFKHKLEKAKIEYKNILKKIEAMDAGEPTGEQVQAEVQG